MSAHTALKSWVYLASQLKKCAHYNNIASLTGHSNNNNNNNTNGRCVHSVYLLMIPIAGMIEMIDEKAKFWNIKNGWMPCMHWNAEMQKCRIRMRRMAYEVNCDRWWWSIISRMQYAFGWNVWKLFEIGFSHIWMHFRIAMSICEAHIRHRCCVCCKHWIDLCSKIGHTRCGDIFSKNQHTKHEYCCWFCLFVCCVRIVFISNNTEKLRIIERNIFSQMFTVQIDSHNNAPFLHLSIAQKVFISLFSCSFLLFSHFISFIQFLLVIFTYSKWYWQFWFSGSSMYSIVFGSWMFYVAFV